MSTITCSKCGNVIEVSHALEDQIRQTIEDKLKVQSRIEIERMEKEAEDKAEKRLRERVDLEQKKRLQEAESSRKQNEELEKELLKLSKQLQETQIKAQNQELQMRKRLIESQEKIFSEAKSKAAEEYKLTIAELTKQISDFKKANEDLSHKIEQRSQQLQGEVLELDLEEILRKAFIYDTIEPVGKGVRGADVRQVVKTQLGNICGVILWESKQTKAWSNEWTGKLKNDLRSEKANIPIIVTAQLPDEARSGFGLKDGVYVISPQLVLPVAEAMRQKLIEIAREKYISQNKGEKAEDLYAYVTGHEFRQQIEALAEAYRDMHGEILKERAAFEKIWKTREVQITKIFSSTARIIGSMRGIIGPSLGQVKGLDLLEDAEAGKSGTDRLV